MNSLPHNSTLTPAYGRSYKTSAKVKADWQAGKDFVLAATGQYTSIRDQAPGTKVMLRFNGNTQIAVFEKPHEKL